MGRYPNFHRSEIGSGGEGFTAQDRYRFREIKSTRPLRITIFQSSGIPQTVALIQRKTMRDEALLEKLINPRIIDPETALPPPIGGQAISPSIRRDRTRLRKKPQKFDMQGWPAAPGQSRRGRAVKLPRALAQ